MSKGLTENLPRFTLQDADTAIVLGLGSVNELASQLGQLGVHRAYLVTGPSVDASPVGPRVRKALGPMLVGSYAKTRPHVPTVTADEVATEARSLRVDVLVGVGGGSPIGTAKAAAFRLQGKGGEAANGPCSVVAIPTTYSGSEVTPVFGTTDVTLGRKEVIREPRVRPRLALYDPELAVYTPPGLTASTGVNALAHCVEGLYSKKAEDQDRVMAVEGTKLLVGHLPDSVDRPENLSHRYWLFEGSMKAGLVLAHAGMGIHHALCHVLGGRYNVPHGDVNAVILPHAMRFNLPAAEGAYRQLAGAFNLLAEGSGGAAVPEQVCAAVADLVRQLKLRTRLRELGVPRADLPDVAEEAMRSKSLVNNPRPLRDSRDALQILEAAW